MHYKHFSQLIFISGTPLFSLISLEQLDDAVAERLKQSKEDSIKKLELSIDRMEHEIGLCSIGTVDNLSLFNVVKAEIGEHYVQVWYPSNHLKLASHDIKSSNFKNSCEKDLSNVYYLFKRPTL